MTSTIPTTARRPTVVGVQVITRQMKAARSITDRSRWKWFSARATTPHLLRIGLGISLLATAVAGVATAVTMEQRRAGAEHLVDEAAPLVGTAEGVFVSLADADAAASSVFLAAGREPVELRQRYLASVRDAGEHLSMLSGSSAIDADARRTMSRELPVYSGLVETARANNRLDFPVGAAYLREASASMRNDLLPAATSAYGDAAAELESTYETIDVIPVAGAVALCGAIAALGGLQVFLALRFRRRISAGLALATVLALVGAAFVAFGIADQHDHSERAQAAHAQAATMSSVRILALRSLSDVNLNLVEQGTEPTHLADFDRVVAQIDGEGGLLELAAEAGVEDGDLTAIRAGLRQYVDVEARVRGLASAGDYRAASLLAVDDLAPAGRELDSTVAQVITRARQAADAAGRGVADVAGAVAGIALICAAVVALAALLGVVPRSREYR